MRARLFGLALVALAACGGDDTPAAATKTPTRAAPRAAPPRPNGPQSAPVIAYRRVEDRVSSDEERRAIRHRFAERDFAPDLTGTENRDPFRSFVVNQPGVGAAGGPPVEATDQCPKKRQWARTFSARELKLVGIVAQGTVRYALFSDPGQYGYVIRSGDCIGKEKARVKDIGASFVTLEIAQEAAPNQPPRPAEQRSIQLHPKDLPVGETDEESDDRGRPADIDRRSDELLRGGGPRPPQDPATTP